MPNSIESVRPVAAGTRLGSLTVVGTGIRAVSHLTQEAIGHIRDADAVFYSVPDGITAAYIRDLNPNATNLSVLYGEDKRRSVTYVQMAEVILRAVRQGKTVVAVFYGHPGYFVNPARRALTIARKEGHATAMLPGISSTDCLFADLRIDPSFQGCQILEATDYLLRDRPLVTSGHVVLLQVGSVGDAYFSYGGFKNSKRAVLFERLIETYGPDHPCVHYVGATFPGTDPQVTRRPLGAYRDPKVLAGIHYACSLYIPPKETLAIDPAMAEKLGLSALLKGGTPAPRRGDEYGTFELEAIAKLDSQKPTMRNRGVSKALYRVLAQMAGSPALETAFRGDPAAFTLLYPGLTEAERKALVGRTSSALHAVSAQVTKAEGPREQDAAELSSTEQDAAELSSSEQDAAELSSNEQDAAELSGPEQDAAELSSSVTTVELSTSELSSSELSSAEQDAAELSSAEQDAAELSSAEQDAAELSTSELSSSELSSVEQDAAELSSTEQDAAELSSAEQDAAELSTAELSTSELSSAELSSAELSSAELSSAEQDAAELSSTEPDTKE
ncbi:hypothetical protein HHL28_10060 [Aerophototrophica crusticola]|uniref:Tetrapyrrole methylase domain-containing protein n=1 Tax=Aerophototrophica crusticola TaxID=1709002 RepID=A0A858R7L8_9PROT|nr:hypothetical protein HHL28_10060 [Rhodospirillaceae bacterium B3]